MKWSTIANEEEAVNKIRYILKRIYHFIDKNSSYTPYGLLGGYCGSLLFLYYYYNYTKKEDSLQLLYNKIELLFSKMPEIPSASFCNGYAGIGWLLRFLHKENIITCSDINDVLSEIDFIVYNHYLYNIQNHDFLHGGLGMAYYLVNCDTPYKTKVMESYIESLNHSKIVNSDNSCMWISDTYVNYEKIGQVYNLSLSHGMAGIISFLLRCVQYDNFKAKSLLKQVVLFYMNNTNPPTYFSTFPKWITPQNERTESALSWCYGDPGIGCALYKAGTVLGDSKLVKLAIQTLEKCAFRISNESSKVYEANFCHGSSSLCHINQYIYQQTQIPCFKKAAIFWLNATISKCCNGYYAGYELPDLNQYSNPVSLLTGLSGVGLTLLAAIYNKFPTWNECVLL